MSLRVDFPYEINPAYGKRVAYFCMEYAIHQPLKTYAGGLGFLAGSHLRSAFHLRQNMIGIGILWKYGYYDQVRKPDRTMGVAFEEKVYGFLEDTGIKFTVTVSSHPVVVAAYYLPPHIFKTAPLYLLSTDLPENDFLSRTICHKLYDSNPETRVAAAILLGSGGFCLLEKLNWLPDYYHLNESHSLPLAFQLYKKYNNTSEVKKRLRFTNHTPEAGGNQKTDLRLLDRMGFFCGIPLNEVIKFAAAENNMLDHTLTALRLSGLANGVSKCHQQTLHEIWGDEPGICGMISITNGQDFNYWSDPVMYNALLTNNVTELTQQKKRCKRILFEEIAEQDGEIFNENILTIVFAKRFGGYKRPALLLHNLQRLKSLLTSVKQPVQVIWAGKPYPVDYDAISMFDRIVHLSRTFPNCATLVGYELKLSRMLKQGADIWLNVPRLTHEACGTSGMSAAMNGAINLSTLDGWFPEFASHGENSFVIPEATGFSSDHQEDEIDATHLYEILETEIIPTYYNDPAKWSAIMKTSMRDISPAFTSDRMAAEYYDRLYKPVSLRQQEEHADQPQQTA